ncbi:MAG TPA: ATP synthase F1 subunit gamma [Flavobacteriales bacterium]|nr:ATP synthase F1 subunit gamma [Flavobacteriales bacterium]
MANLKEIRARIGSVNSTRQITSAMKMVSAAKLKRASDAVIQLRPYANKLQDILSNLSGNVETKFAVNRDLKNVLIVAITSNRGLCGGFNNNVIKAANKIIGDYQGKCNVAVLSIGKKASDFYRHTSYNIKGSDLPHHINEIFDHLTYDEVSKIVVNLMNHYLDGSIDKIVLVYNKFKNAAVQEVTTEQFLPIVPPATKGKNNTDYIFEPSKDEIVELLIPKTLKLQLFKALLDSFASEHGARMTAMHKATDNATEMLKSLKLTYNKARQAAITNEILEIVGGAEALNG